MRPLSHPKIEDITVEGILYALADPVRARIFMELAGAESAKNCSTFLGACGGGASLPKSTLSQHFKVLREAGLVYSERKGVEMHNSTRCAELREKYGALVGGIVAGYAAQWGKSLG